MRWITWTFVILILMPIGVVTGSWIMRELEEKAYYQRNKLVWVLEKADRENTGQQASDAHYSARRERMKQALLEQIPLGTSQEETLRKLFLESFKCEKWNAPPPRSKLAYDCGLIGSRPDFVRHWTIQIDFNDDQKLVHANVLALGKGRFF